MTASLAVFLAAIALGVPIAFALGGAAVIGLMLMDGVPLNVVATRTFGAIDSFTLLAIPFFILAGELMETGGDACPSVGGSCPRRSWQRGHRGDGVLLRHFGLHTG